MAFTSQSGAFARRSRGGKKAAVNQRARGFPALAKARQVRAANRARQIAQQLAMLSGSCCEHCSLRRLADMQSK